jgi:hypothetical protein
VVCSGISAVATERQRSGFPRGFKFRCERVFVLEQSENPRINDDRK